MSKPMFLFAAVYDSVADAQSDYEEVKDLYNNEAIGSYDSNIITKDLDGNVTVKKTEKPARKGAWLGLVAGAAVSLFFPPAMPAVVAAAGVSGAGIGAWIGHLARGTSRKDAKKIGELLLPGKTALIVVGVDKDREFVEKVVKTDLKKTSMLIDADYKEAEKEVRDILLKVLPA